jgi:hypothetical protein
MADDELLESVDQPASVRIIANDLLAEKKLVSLLFVPRKLN